MSGICRLLRNTAIPKGRPGSAMTTESILRHEGTYPRGRAGSQQANQPDSQSIHSVMERTVVWHCIRWGGGRSRMSELRIVSPKKTVIHLERKRVTHLIPQNICVIIWIFAKICAIMLMCGLASSTRCVGRCGSRGGGPPTLSCDGRKTFRPG